MIKVNHVLYARARGFVASGEWRVAAASGAVTRSDGSPVPSRVNSWGYLQLRYRHGSGRDDMSPLAHRVVWEAVHGAIPEGMFINHMNGQKLDNRIANLELVTPRQNQLHAVATGLKLSGEAASGAKLTNAQARDIYRRAHAGESLTGLAREHGVSLSSVNSLKSGRSWANVTADL